mgnify:CR=1 FL=1
MQKFVIDSSVIVKWLHQEDEQLITQADAIINRAKENQAELLAPELAKYEVGNALLVKKKLTPDQAKISLASLYSFPIQFIHESEDIANETYKISCKNNITYYDASFLSLAKEYDATLITDNIKHQGKVSEIKVIPLAKYK